MSKDRNPDFSPAQPTGSKPSDDGTPHRKLKFFEDQENGATADSDERSRERGVGNVPRVATKPKDVPIAERKQFSAHQNPPQLPPHAPEAIPEEIPVRRTLTFFEERHSRRISRGYDIDR